MVLGPLLFFVHSGHRTKTSCLVFDHCGPRTTMDSVHSGPRTKTSSLVFDHCGPRTTMDGVHSGPRTKTSSVVFDHCGPRTRWIVYTLVLGPSCKCSV